MCPRCIRISGENGNGAFRPPTGSRTHLAGTVPARTAETCRHFRHPPAPIGEVEVCRPAPATPDTRVPAIGRSAISMDRRRIWGAAPARHDWRASSTGKRNREGPIDLSGVEARSRLNRAGMAGPALAWFAAVPADVGSSKITEPISCTSVDGLVSTTTAMTRTSHAFLRVEDLHSAIRPGSRNRASNLPRTCDLLLFDKSTEPKQRRRPHYSFTSAHGLVAEEGFEPPTHGL